MKKLLAAIVILLLAGGGGYYYFYTQKAQAPKYKTAPAAIRDIRSTVTASGTASAVKTILVGTQVSGTIKELFVDFNSAVKKGQVLAQLDAAIFESQVEQAQANILYQKANLEKAETSLAEARRNLERNRQLFAGNFIAKNDLDLAETNHRAALAQVKAVQAQIDQGRGALKQAEINLKNTRILSPVDGIVISRNVDVGQTVASSFQTPTLFNIAQDLTNMQISASIDEADIGRVKEGMPVEFTVDAYPDLVFKGQVSQIRNAPVTVQSVVTYEVIVRVANPDLLLKPGMTANVSVVVEHKRGILSVPNAALRFRPPEKVLAALDKKGGKGEDRGTEERKGPPVGAGAAGEAAVAVETGRPGGERKGPPDGSVRPEGERRGPPEGRRGGPGSRGAGVWILEDNKPKRLRVTTGISDGNFTEIVSGEIAAAVEVIVEVVGDPAAKKRPERPLSTGPGFGR